MNIDVVNVGDGACAIYRAENETMIVDCGSKTDLDGVRSSALLEAALGTKGIAPTTIVVSHFDLDHWMGLKAFATRQKLAAATMPVALYYPRFPKEARDAQKLYAAYVALQTANPVSNASSLKDAWDSYAPKVNAESLYQGLHFNALGRRWNVLWPPPSLPLSVSKVFARAIEKGRALAQEYPALGREFERAFGHEWEILDEGDDDVWDLHSFGEKMDVEMDLDLDSNSPDEQGDEEDAFDFEGADPVLKKRLKENRADLQSLNNAMSLVIADEHGMVLTMGDVEKWGLGRLLNSGELAAGYSVIFAPHHGTQSPPVRAPKFPKAELVVVQNGEDHHDRFRADFIDSVAPHVRTTSRHGSIHINEWGFLSWFSYFDD